MDTTFFKKLPYYITKTIKHIFLEIIFSLTSLLLFLVLWLTNQFGEKVSLAQIIKNISNQNSGIDLVVIEQLKDSFIKEVITPSLLLNVLFIFIYCIDKIVLISFFKKIISTTKWLDKPLKILFFTKKHIFTIVLFISYFISYQLYINVSGYNFLLAFSPSFNQHFEHYYIKNPKITFSDTKRDLVFIFLESKEENFQNKDLFTEKLLPNLSVLQQKGISITNHPQAIGTHYNMGVIVSALCGQPQPSFGGKYSKWLHHKLCLSDVLSKRNYNLFFLLGSDTRSGGFNGFAREHKLKGKFAGLNEIKKFDPKWQNEVNDSVISNKRLFQLSKMKLNEFSKSNNPFAFMLFLQDTGSLEPSCQTEFNDYRDVVMCTDKQVGNFIKWIQNQKFAKNTTIVIVGDHLDGLDTVNKEARQSFNVIINPLTSNNITSNTISHVDLFPTVIEALGGKIQGGRIALGTSIFSGKQTLIEEIGENNFNALLFYYCAKGTSNIKDKIRTLNGYAEQ